MVAHDFVREVFLFTVEQMPVRGSIVSWLLFYENNLFSMEMCKKSVYMEVISHEIGLLSKIS